tara:strand:+ start:1300 stop:1458 length:159 start_codon:yes stop_codon:yes gene_type:complete
MLKLDLTEVTTLIGLMEASSFKGKDILALAPLMEKLKREQAKLINEMEKKQK